MHEALFWFTLPILSLLILKTILCTRYYSYAHFTDEEIKRHMDVRSHSSYGLTPGQKLPKTVFLVTII